MRRSAPGSTGCDLDPARRPAGRGAVAGPRPGRSSSAARRELSDLITRLGRRGRHGCAGGASIGSSWRRSRASRPPTTRRTGRYSRPGRRPRASGSRPVHPVGARRAENGDLARVLASIAAGIRMQPVLREAVMSDRGAATPSSARWPPSTRPSTSSRCSADARPSCGESPLRPAAGGGVRRAPGASQPAADDDHAPPGATRWPPSRRTTCRAPLDTAGPDHGRGAAAWSAPASRRTPPWSRRPPTPNVAWAVDALSARRARGGWPSADPRGRCPGLPRTSRRG